MHRSRLALRFLALGLLLGTGWAWSQMPEPVPTGTKTLRAITRDGQSLVLGRVHLTPLGDGAARFRLEWEPQRFTDHFLSMKEFKCLDAPGEVSCHVPYPYAHPGTVRPGDFAWLEHNLLFLFKLPRDFGAKLWNGSYYRFTQQGQRLVGQAQAIDLNHISAPSNTPQVPPYAAEHRTEQPPGTRWIDQLVIE